MVEENNNQQQEQKQENEVQFNSLRTLNITKEFWFLVKLKSDIELIQGKGESVFKRLTESLLVVEFDNLEEARNYFEIIERDENIQFSILTDYTFY